MRVLLVEDDLLLGDGVKSGLNQEGFIVEWLKDGREALNATLSNSFDAIILDLGLPSMNGIEVLQRMRKKADNTPVLILTARDAVSERVSGLDAGADDYMSKPFDLDELGARLRALHRRSLGSSAPLLRHGEIEMDPAAHAVSFHNEPVNLSAREFALLRVLLENAGRIVTRGSLEDRLFGWDNEIESNSLEVFIHHLRKKFGADLIRTVRGIGYTIEKNKS